MKVAMLRTSAMIVSSMNGTLFNDACERVGDEIGLATYLLA